MLNLTKRINKLLEKTSSMECKNACKEVVEMFQSVPEEQLTIALVEKLKGIKDSDKHIEAFLKSATKTMKIKDLGVAKAISKIRESQVYHYPALRYSLDRFERAKINEGVLDYLIVEEFLTSLKDFVWDKNVKDSLEEVKEQYESDKELILVSKAIYEFRRSKGNFIFEKVAEMLEDHFENPTDASRSSLIESLSKFTFSPIAKTLIENLKKIHSSQNKSALHIVAENTNCEVSRVYSTIFLENNKEYFTIKGDLYKKANENIEKVTMEEFNSLSENVKRSFQIMNSPYFFVKEGKASFYVGRNKVEIFEGEDSTKVLFNGKNIASTDIAKNLVATGMIRLEEAKVASDIQFVNDTFSNFFELDFAKVISSRMYEGSYVTLMKVDEKIYLNKVNNSMRSNEFFTDLNATQARNIVLEFLGYDIKESLSEFIEKEEAEILSIKEQQRDLLKSMTILEGELSKIESAKKDPFMASQPQVKSLEEMLHRELSSIKDKYAEVSSLLKKFEAKVSDAGVEIGEDVQILDSGEIATVTAVDSNTKSVSVVTSEGKTKELPLNKIASVEKAEESAMNKNEKDAKKQSEKIEETQNLSNGNEMPVENPHKDKFPAQEPQAQPAEVQNDNPEYVLGNVDPSQKGSCAGKEVEVLATDFTSKGPEDLIQVKCEGELYFIEKKFIQVSASEAEDSLSIDFDAEAPSDEKPKEKKEPEEEEKKEVEEPKEEEPKEEEPKEEEPKEEEKKEVEEPKEEEAKEEEPKEEEKKEEEPKEGEKKEGEKLSVEDLRAKLSKALQDLEEIKNDMKDTFTSNETISVTINSLKGLTDAMAKDLNESE